VVVKLASWLGIGLGTAALASSLIYSASEAKSADKSTIHLWWDAGETRPLPAAESYQNANGAVGIYNANGPVQTKGHPFFEPIGTNGRACITCHQPSDGMSLSAASAQARWHLKGASDPLFAATDGSNCPSLPQDKRESHSLLLERGLFRIAINWPPKDERGKAVDPDFDIEVVRDPTGCNLDKTYGMEAAGQVSVYRRPRPFANLKYVIGSDKSDGTSPPFTRLITPKGTATPFELHPDTGLPISSQIMADARAPTLQLQAADAATRHLEANGVLNPAVAQQIVDFGMQLFMAQSSDRFGTDFSKPGTPEALGPQSLSRNKHNILGANWDQPAFFDFDAWRKPRAGASKDENAFRQSVARGYDLFFVRAIFIRDTMHITTAGFGNPTKRTCVTCHNLQSVGMDQGTGWVDLGTTNLPWAREPIQSEWNPERPQVPLFKITCKDDRPQHIYLGKVIYTSDPGRALITGKCYDVGAIVMQQFRGLSARAPYFSNGSAATLRELVDFYDRRFNIGYTEQERTDLVNFLSVL
jgi:hypothetical protein